MNSSFKIRYLAAGILALLWGLETDAVSQTRSRVRDHRGSENNKEPKIKLPPLEGPTTQWRLLSTPASEKVSSPSDTRYRLTALAPLQLTVNPMTVNSKKDDSELQLSPINAPGMRANITVQPNSSTPGLELNRPFAMYLPEQRAYIFYREQIRAAGEIY